MTRICANGQIQIANSSDFVMTAAATLRSPLPVSLGENEKLFLLRFPHVFHRLVHVFVRFFHCVEFLLLLGVE